MQTSQRPLARFDVERIAEDMALKGWNSSDLARATDLAPQTIGRFLAGQVQTAKTAKKLADALGYSIRRYLISAKAVA